MLAALVVSIDFLYILLIKVRIYNAVRPLKQSNWPISQN